MGLKAGPKHRYTPYPDCVPAYEDVREIQTSAPNQFGTPAGNQELQRHLASFLLFFSSESCKNGQDEDLCRLRVFQNSRWLDHHG